MSLSTYSKDGILTAVFTDARILDDAKIEKQVFKITRLDKLFDIEADDAAARAAFMKRGWFG